MSNTKETINKLRDQLQQIHESGDCGNMLFEMAAQMNELASSSSDLEIVQKALQSGNDLQLRVSGYDWFVVDGSEIIDGGNDFAALLTWAKQTLGMEI